MVKSFQTVDELEQFLLNHGENIVDLMGGEIDRIEMKLRVIFTTKTFQYNVDFILTWRYFLVFQFTEKVSRDSAL